MGKILQPRISQGPWSGHLYIWQFSYDDYKYAGEDFEKNGDADGDGKYDADSIRNIGKFFLHRKKWAKFFRKLLVWFG